MSEAKSSTLMNKCGSVRRSCELLEWHVRIMVNGLDCKWQLKIAKDW